MRPLLIETEPNVTHATVCRRRPKRAGAVLPQASKGGQGSCFHT